MANEVNIKIKADDMASGKIDGISNRARDLRGSFVKLAAAGTAVTGMLGIFTKAALDQQVGVNLLDNALKIVNTSYADQEVALEKTFASIQKLTNFGDDEQRNVLQKLIRATGDYELSLQALPVILDVAAGAQRDVVGTTDAIARALNGSIGGLSRYGIEVREGSDALSTLAQITERYEGAAEAAKDPTTDLANLIGDLQEAIGDKLLPVLQPTAESLSEAVTQVINWTTENPKLTQVIVLGTAALAGLAVVIGVIGIAIPAIISGLGLLAKGLLVFGALGGIFAILNQVTNRVVRDLQEFIPVEFDLVNASKNLANTLKDQLLGAFDNVTTGTEDNTDALDKNINKVKELTQAEIDAIHHKERLVRDNLALHKSELEEIEEMDKQHRKVIGAQIRAEQKAKQAARTGDFSMTFSDFLAIENARVMGMPDIISTGPDVSDPLANAFRNFARGSQMSEHGERGRIAQERLKKLLDRSNMIADPSLGGGVPEVNISINGDIYGMDDFNIKTEQAVVSGINAGAIPYTEDEF
jgi:hypothetical protein